MKISFGYATQLQYENKALRERIRLLESGEAYLRLRKEYERLLEEKERNQSENSRDPEAEEDVPGSSRIP